MPRQNPVGDAPSFMIVLLEATKAWSSSVELVVCLLPCVWDLFSYHSCGITLSCSKAASLVLTVCQLAWERHAFSDLRFWVPKESWGGRAVWRREEESKEEEAKEEETNEEDQLEKADEQEGDESKKPEEYCVHCQRLLIAISIHLMELRAPRTKQNGLLCTSILSCLACELVLPQSCTLAGKPGQEVVYWCWVSRVECPAWQRNELIARNWSQRELKLQEDGVGDASSGKGGCLFMRSVARQRSQGLEHRHMSVDCANADRADSTYRESNCRRA